ncbi:MAG: guanylate kinase, partial [Anaerolineaceae bacterium]
MEEPVFTPQLIQKYPLMVVISGPSGIGKDSVVKRLSDRDGSFFFVVTATDRGPRPGEIDGVDYIFISKERFQEMIENDELIEHARVYSDYKGVPRAHVEQALRSGKDVILRLDVQGAARIRKLFPEAVLIFLLPESDEIWMERLQNRRTETQETLRIRQQAAREELEYLPIFDYAVVNETGQLEKTVDRVLAVIQTEHCR